MLRCEYEAGCQEAAVTTVYVPGKGDVLACGRHAIGEALPAKPATGRDSNAHR